MSKWQAAPCARLLAEARRDGVSITTLPPSLAPRNEAEAYAIQGLVLTESNDTIGGWKVGAKGADAPINGGLLPRKGIHRSGVVLQKTDFQWVGLELEIAFVLGRDFAATAAPYTEAEILDSIVSMQPTIELVTSRIRPNPENPRIWAVADLLNHGALIVGDTVPYDPTYPFLSPALTWTFNGQDIRPSATTANPAGDPRRLLAWTVNHCCAQGWDFRKEMIITAGTYTGAFKTSEAGEAIGNFAGLGEVRLALQ